eukprot:351009-Chlamydomonas_euryale.AAC.7
MQPPQRAFQHVQATTHLPAHATTTMHPPVCTTTTMHAAPQPDGVRAHSLLRDSNCAAVPLTPPPPPALSRRLLSAMQISALLLLPLSSARPATLPRPAGCVPLGC